MKDGRSDHESRHCKLLFPDGWSRQSLRPISFVRKASQVSCAKQHLITLRSTNPAALQSPSMTMLVARTTYFYNSVATLHQTSPRQFDSPGIYLLAEGFDFIFDYYL
jgi:hypothetical protein